MKKFLIGTLFGFALGVATMFAVFVVGIGPVI